MEGGKKSGSGFSQMEEDILALGEELAAKNGDVHDDEDGLGGGGTSLTQKHLFDRFKSVTKEDKMAVSLAVNKLVKSRRMMLIRSATGELEYKLMSDAYAVKYLQLNDDHMKVLQEIKCRGNKGIFKRELKRVTGFLPGKLTRLLKTLESRKLIKAVKTITSKNMNLYVAWNVTPSRMHTGGPWYTDQEFDVALVEKLSAWMFKTIRDNQTKNGGRESSLEHMATTLNAAKVLSVELTVDDLKLLLKKLMYENKIEAMAGQSHLPFESWAWKLSAPVRSFNYLVQVPCGVCPVKDQCNIGGIISPTTCMYMQPWLEDATSEVRAEWEKESSTGAPANAPSAVTGLSLGDIEDTAMQM